MARRKRQSSTFNLSFLDIMSCGFGAVVLVFLIIDHSLEVEIRTVNAEVLSEVELLEEDIREGEAGLVRLRNALDDVDLDIVEADGLARRITEELDEYEALIASIEESGVSDSDAIAKLQAEINQLEEEIRLLEEASEAEAGRSAREFVGEGNRQYLTGLNLGGRRIAIMVDTSASMLANQLVNVIRLRNMDPELQKQAGKWTRTLDTVDWLTAQLPVVDGRFTWDRLPPGRWKIFVSASGGERVWQEVTLLPDRPRATFRIPRSAVLTGVVLDRDGAPAPTTRVVAESDAGEVEQTDTDERGRFRLEHLAAGTWRVRGHLGSAHRSARTEEQRAVVSLRADEGKGLTLRYPNGPRVCVHVVDGRGRSIKRARIQVTRRDFGRLPDIWPSSQGRATYGPLAPGEYEVVVDRVEQPGAAEKSFMEAQRRTLSVVAGQEDFELEIVVK